MLYRLIQQGDIQATAEILDRYKNKIYTAVFLLVKDKYLAEDIFQETCIKVIHCIRENRYEHSDKFLGWALRIARNLTLDYLRKVKRNVKVVTSEGVDIFSMIQIKEESIEEKMIQEQEENKFVNQLQQLPLEQREVVVLRFYANLSFKEIAKLTQVSVNTALGRMRYAILNLRKLNSKTNSY